MMASDGTSRRPGRPRGADAETLEKGRLYLALIGHGIAPGEIATREGVSRSEVYRAINLVQPPAAVDPTVDGTADRSPGPLRKLSRRTAQYRAWDYADRRPSFALGLAANSFWVRIVIAVHEDGDGFRLRIGEEGARFRARTDLAILLLGQLDRSEVQVDGWLKALFEHGRLIDLDGGDVAIPVGLGLTPGENVHGKQMSPRAPRQSANATQPALTLLRQVNEGREVSGEIPPFVSGETRIYPDAYPPISPDTFPRISPDTVEFGRAAVADAYAKDICDLTSASATESRAHVSGEIRGGVSGEIPPRVSGETRCLSGEIPPPPSSGQTGGTSIAGLTAEMKALVSPGRPANAKDLGAIQRMLNEGETAQTIEDLIQIKMKDWKGPAANSLAWFITPAREARERRCAPPVSNRPQAAAPATQPIAPLSEADQVLKDRLRAAKHDHSPPFSAFQARGTAALAHRWIDLSEAIVKAGRSDLKPPAFTLATLARATFDADMLEIEEELLTAPDPPQAAD